MTAQPELNADRQAWYTRYRVFERFALRDQRAYYQDRQRMYQRAAGQVNFLRALFAFLTGLSAAAAGLIVTLYLAPGALRNDGVCAAMSQDAAVVERMQAIDPDFDVSSLPREAPPRDATPMTQGECDVWGVWARFFMVMAVVAPALGGAFTTLADLYQWDRLTGIYEVAEENLEVADSQSPLPEMDRDLYIASVRALVEGTLDVMSDETAQWGQSIRTPRQIEEFIAQVQRGNGNGQDGPEDV